MLCEICKQQEASHMVTKSIQGEKVTQKICEECLSSLVNKQKESSNAFSSLYNGQTVNSTFAPNVNNDTEEDMKNKKSKQKTFLDKFADNLTEMGSEGKLDPVIGREVEIKRLQHILCRRTKNNPVLIGQPGIGKSAIVEGLAKLIAKDEVPFKLKNKQIYSLNVNSLIAGTKFRGEFEERLQKIIDQVISDPNIILFIDELHNIVGAGSSEGSGDAANILKPHLARGRIRCIGATTLEEYRKHIEKDGALERRFGPINVKEPTDEQSIKILMGLKSKYEQYHKVEITEEAVKKSVNLASRYINDRYMPDKAIDLMDEAAAKLSLNMLCEDDLSDKKAELIEIKNRFLELKALREEAKKQNKEDLVEKYEKEMEDLKDRVKVIKENNMSDVGYKFSVTEEDIADVLSTWTGIPVTSLSNDDKKKMLELESKYSELVIGQERAVEALSNAIRLSITDIKDPKLPMGSFIFAGPSGVGKTHIAKMTAKLIFNSEENMIRIDMSEYMEKHAISKLIGSPPGYVGHDDSNQLCEPVRKNPYQVILFDEIEKAHPDVFNLLLQLLDDGHLTDAKGRKVDFKNTIICMTTNLGTSHKGGSNFGFVDSDNAKNSEYEKLKSSIDEALKNNFRPEFLNRVDETIVFAPLVEEELLQIVDLLLENIKERLSNKGINISLTKGAKEVLVKQGFNRAYGARPLRRTIKRKIEIPVAMHLLEERFSDGDMIVVKVNRKKELIFTGGK